MLLPKVHNRLDDVQLQRPGEDDVPVRAFDDQALQEDTRLWHRAQPREGPLDPDSAGGLASRHHQLQAAGCTSCNQGNQGLRGRAN